MEGDLERQRERLEQQAVHLYAAGKLDEAHALFHQIVALDPENPRGLVNIGYICFRLGNHADAESAYRQALALDPRHVQAHHGMSAVLAAVGDRIGSERHLFTACRIAPIRVATYRGEGTPIRVLQLLSAGSGNLNAKELLSDRHFLVTTLFVDCVDENVELPEHDVLFNGIGDPDAAAVPLKMAARFMARSTAPAFNAPRRVAESSRSSNAMRLAKIPGVRTARTVRVAKRSVVRDASVLLRAGMQFPLLLRSEGFHNGEYFERFEDAEHLANGAERLPGDELYAIEFLDLRSSDGKVRKYRAIIVDGDLFPLHAAISPSWKVHYGSADMDDFAEHRAEDERFLNDMGGVLGERGVAALEAVSRTLGLEYGGIDFSLDDAGNVVVFEANATMLVPAVPQDPRWEYRREPTRRIAERFAQMLGVLS